MRYSKTDESLKLKTIQTVLRYLLRRAQVKSEIPLDESLPMIDHIDQIIRQLGALKGYAQEAALAEMVEHNVEEIETDDFTAILNTGNTRVQVDNSAVAEQVFNKLVEQEIKRNKRINPMAVRSILAKGFWTIFDVSSIKWKKRDLKKRFDLDLEDYSEAGSSVNRIEVKSKHV